MVIPGLPILTITNWRGFYFPEAQYDKIWQHLVVRSLLAQPGASWPGPQAGSAGAIILAEARAFAGSGHRRCRGPRPGPRGIPLPHRVRPLHRPGMGGELRAPGLQGSLGGGTSDHRTSAPLTLKTSSSPPVDGFYPNKAKSWSSLAAARPAGGARTSGGDLQAPGGHGLSVRRTSRPRSMAAFPGAWFARPRRLSRLWPSAGIATRRTAERQARRASLRPGRKP
jgi:hypothetical protein